MTDKCQRCGEVGEDRRMLWMACFYEMGELGIPFEKRPAFTNREPREPGMAFPTTSVDERITFNARGDQVASGQYTHNEMYTLLVCKECRGSWMGHIRQWFENVVKTEVHSGIFIRRDGRNLEISEEEWYRLHPGRKPVRVRRAPEE
jgi:hypothetical protein